MPSQARNAAIVRIRTTAEECPPAERRDRRTRRTRHALLQAFGQLVLERPYDDIRVADILDRADVGRSTFYEHYRSKDDVLRQAVSMPLASLAQAVDPAADAAGLERMLEHFGQNRRFARGLLRGSGVQQVQRALRDLLESALARRAPSAAPAPVPPELAAIGVAAAQIGLVTAWITEDVRCSSRSLALALRKMTLGLVAALH